MAAEIKVALIKPVPFSEIDNKISLEKIKKLIRKAYEKDAELISFLSCTYSELLTYGSSEFESIIETIKKYPIHIILEVFHYKNSFLYIIDNNGNVVLKRKNCELGLDCGIKTVVTLEFKEMGPIEIGYLLGSEHFNPLLIYNSALQKEKLHFGSWPKPNNDDSQKTSSYVSKTYSAQIQSFFISNVNTTSGVNNQNNDIKVFAPNGSIVKESSNKEKELIIYSFNMDEIIKQKILIDIVGHSSKSAVTFQSIIKYNGL